MYIKPEDKTIKDILLSKRQFIIPRFQREYSWEKKNYKEFWEDILSCIKINDKGEIVLNQYFLGTMLFIGNYTDGIEKEIQVVDGQQRLTTITILFSALSDRFKEINEETLSKRIFEYVMTQDDDGNDVKILHSKTHYPYFSFFIQDRDKKYKQTPDSEEEKCILEAYNFFYQQLDETNIREELGKSNIIKNIYMVKYVDLLKSVRDQVLNSIFVSISTTDKEYANKIFEILNAKGKRLANIDLIKNKIFEKLNTTQPADYAYVIWEQVKENLNSGLETVGFATFYRHFWVSAYKKSSTNALYDDFKSVIKEKDYEDFLNKMLDNSKIYMKIVNPKREDYDNKKQYYWLVQSLYCLNNYFNIIQTRIILLALFDAKNRNMISMKTFKSTILFIENFHFAYNAIAVKNSNRFEPIYSKAAIAIRNAPDKNKVNEIIQNQLLNPLKKLMPLYDEFEKNFIKLVYSKKDCPSNIKVKYIINKLHCYYEGTELFDDEGSIEHILPEVSCDESLNIGNLILLENELNNDAGNKDYEDKKNIYKKSKYKEIAEFCEENEKWDVTKIDSRAKILAKTYYENIIGIEILEMH